MRARTPAQQKDEEQREDKDMTSTINRRSFLKWAAAAGGTAALSSSLLCTTACSADAAAEGASDITANVTDAISDGNPYGADKIVPVICTCGDVCGMVHTANAYVKDGAIVYYEGNADGNNAGHLCPRGMAGLEIINSPNRIKYPMRRTNEKGVQGEFERISWDEAIETVTDAIVTAINESGPRTVAFGTASAHPGNQMLEVGGAVMRKLFNFDTGSGPGGCWNDLKIGPVATLGDMYHALEHDPFHSKLIIFWGDNSAMAKPQEWGASWGEAKFEHGAKIVSIESRISETSEKADIYLPVRPGTDSYLAMAMANVIITEGLQDQEFIDKYTVGYEEFKEVALRYTPELVEQITWTPADKIREVARLYATTKPAMIEIGRGGNQTGGKNSDAGWMMGRAVTCLIPLCGQVGVRGSGLSLETSVGAFNGNIFHWNMGKTYSAPTNRVKPLFETDQKAASGVWGTSKVLYERDPYGYRVFVTNGNVAGSTGDYAKAEAAFKQMDLVVMHNRIINWTGSAFADILLPACSWAEEYVWRPDWEYSGVSAPAIDPMFECRNDLDIFRTIAITLANKLNLGLSDEEVWPWATDKDFMAQILCNDDIKAEFQKRVDEGKEKFAPFAEGDIDFIASQAFGVPNPYYAGQEEFLPYQAKYYTNNGAPADDPEALWFPTDGGNGKALFKADFLTTASNGVLPALPHPVRAAGQLLRRGQSYRVRQLGALRHGEERLRFRRRGQSAPALAVPLVQSGHGRRPRLPSAARSVRDGIDAILPAQSRRCRAFRRRGRRHGHHREPLRQNRGRQRHPVADSHAEDGRSSCALGARPNEALSVFPLARAPRPERPRRRAPARRRPVLRRRHEAHVGRRTKLPERRAVQGLQGVRRF